MPFVKQMCKLVKLLPALALVAALPAVPAGAQDRSQGRSVVMSKGGIVAAESPLAAQAGVRILDSGGNAVDAAISTNAMMGVVEPMMNGIGGDLFAIVYDAKANKLYGLNSSGWAPKSLTIDYLHKQGLKEMPQKGINAVTVPRDGGRLAKTRRQIRAQKAGGGFGCGNRHRPRRLSCARNYLGVLGRWRGFAALQRNGQQSVSPG